MPFRMTVNRFDAPLAMLEVELEKARVKRRLIREATEIQDHAAPAAPTKTNTMNLQNNPPEKSNDGTVRKHPIQRAPSRLYRTVIPAQGNPRAKYCCPNTCIGPEFVVNSSSSVKHIRMTDIKHSSQIRRITVILLNGRKLKVSCNINSMTTGQLFEVVVNCEAIEDNFTLGLAVLLGGDFVFPPCDFRLSKISPAGLWDECRRPHSAAVSSLLEPFGGHPPLTMYMRTKFFLPTLRGIRSWNLKHQLYLQLRRCLLEQQLRCPSKGQLLLLMGYALQAEFGDFTEKEHGCGDYFLLEHYLPDVDVVDEIILRKELQVAHQERIGLDPGRAEEMFISLAQQFSEYGTHFYSASCTQKSGKDVLVWLAISASGVSLHEWRSGAVLRPTLQSYHWKDIRKLSYSRQQFCLQPTSGKRVKLKMDLRKSYFTFRLASMQHQFFLKYRAELSSLQSVAADFGVPLRKSNLSYVESQEPQDMVSKTQDVKSVLGAVLGPVKSRQVVDLPSPPKATCRFSQLASILGAAVAGTTDNIEEIQNKENELPAWASRSMHNRCGSYDSIGLFRDVRHDLRWKATSPQSTHASVSPASTISRTSAHTCVGVIGCENRTPSFPRRSGVRMGTRAFSLGNSCQTLIGTLEHQRTLSAGGTPCGTRTPSECSAPSSPFAEAYVINSSIRSVDEHYRMNSHESISESLAEKMGNVSFEEERVLRTIRLQRDRLGSFGIEIVEGEDGGVYIQSVQRGGAAAKLGSIHRGDRLIAVDGHCLLNRKYEETLRLMRATGEEVELVLSQAAQSSSDEIVEGLTSTSEKGPIKLADCNIKNTPVEETYLREIRYHTEECPTPQHIMMPKPLPQPVSASVAISAKWTAHKKYPAPKPPHIKNLCYIAPVPEDCSDVLDCTI